MDDDVRELARRLRMARASLGITMGEAARMAGVSPSSVSLWESGKRDPGILGVKRLAVAYGVSLDWLFGLSDGDAP